MVRLISILIIFSFFESNYAQQNIWVRINTKDIPNRSEKQTVLPRKFTTYKVDFRALYSTLESANRSLHDQIALDIPLPNDELETFAIQSTPVFAKELSSKYPGYYSFTGKSVHSAKTIKISASPYGFHAMIFNEQGEVTYIDPYLDTNNSDYIVYHKKDYVKQKQSFSCSVQDTHETLVQDISVQNKQSGSRFGDCTLRSYRLALACTGEYAAYHGGTIEKVLAAYNATMTRVNGLYERDAAITMVLIGDTDKLIFLNASTDPYSNADGSAMLSQNQNTVNNIIGISNYDIGHVFSTAGGGIASLRSPCGSRKAQGVTGQNNPIGDPFDIDYVAHEMGHQFGGNHTFNNSCQGNRNESTAIEPGSGSTIMGYAGICDPNVQSNSDAHFHTLSLGEIANFVVAGNGNTCAEKIILDNNKPTVEVRSNVYTIPKATSFQLTAIGNDIDDDNLTYCWEQMDAEIATMPPNANNVSGPAFRSLPPSSSPTRYFPDLQRRYASWEVLPIRGREMNFSCTVRDNAPFGGCTDDVSVRVTVTDNAGPFTVTYPNVSSVNWLVGSKQTVTWNVNNTNIAPVNCLKVDILLSIDGGISYPIIVVKEVENTGSYEIDVPSHVTNTARIMVVASDNIFFDVSNSNFKITSTFDFTLSPNQFTICDEKTVQANIELSSLTPSQNEEVTLSLGNSPSQLTYSILNNPITIPNTTSIIIGNTDLLPIGYSTIEVKGNKGLEILTKTIELLKSSLEEEVVTLLNPDNFKSNIPYENVKLNWSSVFGIKNYTVKISENPNFTDSQEYTTDETFLFVPLESGKVYYWTVQADNPCLVNPFAPFNSFKTTGEVNAEAILLKNNVLLADKILTNEINSNHIDFISGDDPKSHIVITSLPINGLLYSNGMTVEIGDNITLEDIKLQKLIYQFTGSNEAEDLFTFDIVDNLGRWLPGNEFRIVIKQTKTNVASKLNDVTCYGMQNGSIVANTFGIEGPASYSLDSITFTNDSIFTNLSAGSYYIYVQNMDGSIFKSNEVTLSEPDKLTLTVSNNKYDIRLDVSGGLGDIELSLDGQIFTPFTDVIQDPGNGDYSFYVRDYNGCLDTQYFALDIPMLNATSDLVEDIFCPDQKAKILIVGTGGISPYTYSIDGSVFVANNTIDVSSGTYRTYIKDAGGKIFESNSITTNLVDPIAITITRNKFTVAVSAQGGTAPYTYSIDGVNYSSNNIFILPGNGTYKFYVTDSLGCKNELSISIFIFSSVTQTVKNVSCKGLNDGSVRLFGSNGVPPIVYSFNNSSYSSNREFLNLSPGQYDYSVIDSKNDTVVGSVTITEPDSLLLDYIVENNTIILSGIGGTSPYQYSINGGEVFSNIFIYDDLEGGSYPVVIKDKNGCVDSTLVLISSIENELDNHLLNITPNPGYNNLEIHWLGSENLSNKTINIYNLNGYKLKSQMIEHSQTKVSINTQELPSGVYLIQCKSNEKSYYRKWIKS